MTTSLPVHDFRPLAPVQRHRLAFETFEALAPGQAFELINDHEPRGLLMQFDAYHPGAFSWEVVDAQPEAWRIRVGRLAAPSQAPSAARDGGCCACSCG